MRLKRALSFGLLGNLLEWYDFSIYIVLAPVIGRIFFNTNNLQHSLLLTLMLFSISYFIRPIGSLIFGYIGDTFGCGLALKLSLFLMGIPTLVIALLPSHKTIGVLSTIGLICCRLVQGIAAGGELPLSACYMYEHAKPHQRRFFCSFVAASSMGGVLLGHLTGAILLSVASHSFLLTIGWRIPFIIGASIMVFVYVMRRKFNDVRYTRASFSYQALLQHLPAFLITIGLYAFISVTFYTAFVWLPSYMHVYLAVPLKESFYIGSIGMASLIFFTVLFGYINRRLSERTCVWVSIGVTLLFVYPLFVACQTKSLMFIFAMLFFMSMALGLMDSVIFSLVVSLFNHQVRCFGMGVSFTLANAVFGGLAPTICSYFINKTGLLMIPMIVMIIAAMFGLLVSFYVNTSQPSLLQPE